ncbi:ArnT family glycosyltransferase [Thermodesulfobacteriota bacterium]
MEIEKYAHAEPEDARSRNDGPDVPRIQGLTAPYSADVYYWAIFLVCLSIHLYSSTVGWDNLILEKHGFRQTQTALSAFYVVKEGFRLDYITPVFGPPWSIPMEFPLYQWVTALLVILSGYDLEKAGRLVSVLFFYLTLIPVFWLSKYFLKETGWALIVLCLILVNPIYLFWSRSFMIESTALFFSTLYLWLFLKFMESEKKRYFLTAITCGTLGGLVKVTTFAAFLVAAFFIYIHFIIKNKNLGFTVRYAGRYILYGCFLTLIPLAVAFAWVYYGDSFKVNHPFAYSLTSASLKAWNYGTLTQKLSADVWQTVFELTGLYQSVGRIVAINSIALHVAGFILFMALVKRRKLLVSLAAVYLAAPLIFTNLYFVHDYYHYANTIFFCAVIGLFCVEIIKSKKTAWSYLGKYMVLPGFLVLFLLGYFHFYYHFQARPLDQDQFVEFTHFLKENTSEDDVLMFIGFSWDPRYAFYSQRKVLMARHIDPDGSHFSRFLDEMKSAGLKVKAIIFTENKAADAAYIQKLVSLLNHHLQQETDDSSILLMTVKYGT